ncbi:hypothetical protein PRZ48_014623 [Zasmidium cellare]|uniref:Heterokaryon incompatibility domain-containing protein n=1 Tax=Zasmidium cellare TaxID=395010 RepID=A0ABR0DYT0_ZASCE|nr:hypothetical protein PRZ48_014623 [Zasmidium cellare]
MRLINVQSLELESYSEGTIPSYITLSHRWLDEKDEVKFEEYDDEREKYYQGQQVREGFEKIWRLCEFVRKGAFVDRKGKPVLWVWVDTCCIDKRSSSELSESINSMARYYWDAVLCVAYLADVPSGGPDQTIWQSEWFTRGWCLQELLFPWEIVFCDKVWGMLGRKRDGWFQRQLSARTGIDEECLESRDTMLRQCVAKKMSWASRRVTKRTEDLAYCLLGLFNIQMALLYGEGMNAFARLQEEIVRQTDDESVFAWTLPESMHKEGRDEPDRDFTRWTIRNSVLIESQSVFAPHPKYFGNCWRAHLAGNMKRPPYRITNKGLEFQSQTWEVTNENLGEDKVTVVELNCGNVVDLGDGQWQDRSFLMVLGEMNTRGRFQRLELSPTKVRRAFRADGHKHPHDDPRLAGKQWQGDGYMWQFFHGFDAENTIIKQAAGTLYIQALSSIKSLGGQAFNGENFMTLTKAVDERVYKTLSMQGLINPTRLDLRRHDDRGRSSSHSSQPYRQVDPHQEYRRAIMHGR